MDLHTVSRAFAAAIFENGVLFVGAHEHATGIRRQLTAAEPEQLSPRERLDAALTRIDAHLDDNDTGEPASGTAEDDDGRVFSRSPQPDSDRWRNYLSFVQGNLAAFLVLGLLKICLLLAPPWVRGLRKRESRAPS